MAKIKPPKPGAVPRIVDFDATQAQFKAVADTFEKVGDQLDHLNGDLTLGANTVGSLKLLEVQLPAVPPWADVTLSSPWTAWGASVPTAQSLVEPGGRARLTGYVKGGAPGAIIRASPGPLWAPVGARQRSFPVASTAYSVVVVAANGDVYYDSVAGSPNPAVLLNLDGVSWECGMAPSVFTGRGWPMQVEHGFVKCGGILVLGVIAADGSNAGVGIGTPMIDWQDLGNGKLRINGIWGLAWGRSYRVLVYISPEEA